jgi:hypothetical protein
MKVMRLAAYGILALALAGWGAAYASDATVEGPTGPHSNNVAEVNEKNKLDLDVDNDFDAAFDFDDIDVDTGDNDVKYNTTAGDNKSGEATVDIALDVAVEQDSSGPCECLDGLFNGAGDHSATVEGPTGPFSDNFATVNVKNKADIDVHNYVDIDVEEVDVDIDTGGNESKYNTTVGDTESGDATFKFSATYKITQK